MQTRPAHTLNIVSLKLKYAGAAFAAVLVGTLIVMALLAWQQRAGTREVAELAQGFSTGQVDVEVQARANATARHAAEAAAPLIARTMTEALTRRMQRFSEDPTVSALVVRDVAGNVLYQWHRDEKSTRAPLKEQQAIEPVRAMVETVPGAVTPRTAGRSSRRRHAGDSRGRCRSRRAHRCAQP